MEACAYGPERSGAAGAKRKAFVGAGGSHDRAVRPQRGMFERVDAFVREVGDIGSEADLAEALDQIAKEMGFRYFALTHHVDRWQGPVSGIRLDNYPPDWVEYFDEARLGPSDPIHRASHLTSIGFAWSQLPDLIDLTPRDLQILDRAGRQGLGDGFTVPAHVPGEVNGSCSFATAPGEAVREEHLPLAQLVGAFSFEAARQLWRSRLRAPGSPPRLTDRQRDCLLWAARGKSDWETSRILDVSEETVSRHLAHARQRYGVNKRTSLAIQALFDGTLSFIEILKR